jgi:ribonuclease D
LIQVGAPSGDAALIDPIAIGDLSALARVVADPSNVIVLHAGDNDVVELKRHHGLRFATLFDTSIAARFAGHRELGLEVLLERLLGVVLPPSRQKDDWSARPLTPAQIEYAAADVQHLGRLKAYLIDELIRLGRLAWVEEESRALADLPAPERPFDPYAYASMKGARELNPLGLAVLRELYELREQLARSADRPPFKILSDDILVRIALAVPGDTAALAQLPGCTARVISRWGPQILAAIQRGAEGPEPALPRQPRNQHRPWPAAARRRSEALRQWRARAATLVGLDAGVVLPNRLIGAIAEAGPRDLGELSRVEGLRQWRLEAFGRELLGAMAGSSGIR